MSKATSRPVETFSAGFDFDEYSELPYAKAVAERHGTSHHEFQVRADAAGMLPVLARLYEEPFADCSALPSYLLAREARRHVTVVLTGDGGDEGFIGYPRYSKLADWDTRLGVAARLGVGRCAKWAAGLSARLDAIGHLADPRLAVRYGWMMRLFSQREQARLLRNGTPTGEGEFERLMDDPAAGPSPVDRMSFADTRVYLPDDLLVKVDLATMAHGLEARSPLLDPEVLAVAASAPAEVKYRSGSLKSLLKEAFPDALPSGIANRKKMGFVVPLDEWFRGPLQPLARDLLLSPGTRVRDYMRDEPLRELVESHAEGRASRGRQLWALVMLELWQREVLDPARVGLGSQREAGEKLGASR
jgi:asparagine synthase (glutamine-hydrolysing)